MGECAQLVCPFLLCPLVQRAPFHAGDVPCYGPEKATAVPCYAYDLAEEYLLSQVLLALSRQPPTLRRPRVIITVLCELLLLVVNQLLLLLLLRGVTVLLMCRSE